MEEYIKILNYAIPGFVLLIGIEFGFSFLFKKKVYRSFDTISSLSSGMTNLIKDVLGLSIVIISYAWMVDKISFFEIESTLWLYVFAFIGIDFAGYWSHRFEHVINILWNRHLIHHSSEEFNLACALRQPISNLFSIFFFLYIPMALIGIPSIVIATIAPLHLFAQFWYHTKLINSLGPLELILVTPSHHRVHHAINKEYLDKNFSQIFIIWDRLFGTFQKEIKEIPPVYGIKRPVQTWNPIVINFKHLWLLLKDAWRSKNWVDKLRIWFMPTGWRPEGFDTLYPENQIEEVYSYEKYDSTFTVGLGVWSWAQMIFHLFLILFLFNQLSAFPFHFVLIGALALSCSIFAFTSLMDRSFMAIIAEGIKFVVGFYLIFAMGGWFNIDQYFGQGTMMVQLYLILSMFATVYFLYFEKKQQLSFSQ